MQDSAAITKILDEGWSKQQPVRGADQSLSVFVPAGYQKHVIPPIEPPLLRVHQRVIFTELESFLDYTKKFKRETTVLFGEPGHLAKSEYAHIDAVIDYHKSADEAMRLQHVAAFQPVYSEEWSKWVSGLPPAFEQREFAEFIEENRSDIREPTAASMLDLVTKFKASKKVEFNSVTYQPNGDVKMGWDESTQALGRGNEPITVPTEMKLGIPVFFKGELYEVPLFIRYKVGGGKVMFQLKPDRADLIESKAFEGMVKKTAETLSLPVWLGSTTYG